MTGHSTTISLTPGSIVDGDAASGFLILCDHASNALPQSYGTLGLPAAELERHIAYDIGAATVARTLADALGAQLACLITGAQGMLAMALTYRYWRGLLKREPG